MFENINKKIVSEKDTFKSPSHYGRYKIEAYKYIMSFKRKYKLNAATAILFNHDSIYRKSNFLIPKLVNAFQEKDFNYIKNIYELNINGDFSHAEDICDGIYKLSLYKKNINKIKELPEVNLNYLAIDLLIFKSLIFIYYQMNNNTKFYQNIY